VRDAYGPHLSGPNTIFIRLRPGVSPAAGRRALARLVRRINADARAPAVTAQVGPFALYTAWVSVLPVQRPAEIVNYKAMGAMPVAVAAALAAGAMAALGVTLVTSVRRRRRDLALLKALGCTRRQLAGAVAWQATITAAAGLVIGVPLGIAAGRWLWLAFARQLSAVPDPVIPAVSLAAAAAAALILANLVAVGPGWRAARTPAAVVLRAE
jgi:FtsX-like permease family